MYEGQLIEVTNPLIGCKDFKQSIKGKRGNIIKLGPPDHQIMMEDGVYKETIKTSMLIGLSEEEISPTDYRIGDIIVNTHKACIGYLPAKVTMNDRYNKCVRYQRPNEKETVEFLQLVRLASPEEIETYKKALDKHICDHCGKEMGKAYYEDWNLILCHICYTKEKEKRDPKDKMAAYREAKMMEGNLQTYGEKVMKVGQRVECLKVYSSEATVKWVKDTHPKGIIREILDADDNYDYRVEFDDETPYGSKRLNFKKDEIRAIDDANIIASEPFISATPEALDKAQERLIGQYATWGQGGHAYRVLDIYIGHFEYDSNDYYHLPSGEHMKSPQICPSDMRLDVEKLRIVDVTSYSKAGDQKEFYNEKLGVPFDTCSTEDLKAAEEIYDKLKLSAAAAIVEAPVYEVGDLVYSTDFSEVLEVTEVHPITIMTRSHSGRLYDFLIEDTNISIASEAAVRQYHRDQGWTVNEDGSRTRIIESDDKPPSFDVSSRV